MADNGDTGEGVARTMLLVSSVLAVAALAMPWFAQYDQDAEDPRLRGHEWIGLGLAEESAYDGHSVLGTFPAMLVPVATIALMVVAVAAAAGQRRAGMIATGLGLALLLGSLWMSNSATGIFGEGHLVGTMFGLWVWRLGLLLYAGAAVMRVLELDARAEERALRGS